ncbi:MAG: peptidylprolyl isomerase [Verrucomicrobiota bacterium]|jgi:parvulin-like peptidyl-prolyl isomerase
MKRYLLILLGAAVGCVAPRAGAELADGVKAIVNDTVITYAQVGDLARLAAEDLRRQYAADPAQYAQKLDLVLSNSLEILVERQLILHEFDSKYNKIPDATVDQWVQDKIREDFGDRVTAMQSLQAQGITLEQFRKDVRDQIVEADLRHQNVAQEIVISPYKVETYYLAHQNDYKVEDEVKLRMLVLNKSSPDETNTLTLAREIRGQIKEGATFQEMAAVYSQGSQQKQGGDWGWVERSVLRKELADVAFALKPGELSDVIDTPEACYLMLVEEARTAHVKSLSDVRSDIEKSLRDQEQARLQAKWIDSLKKNSFIEIFQ